MTSEHADAFEYYDKPAHREPVPGEPRRRRAQVLARHVPVRFPAETIEAVQRLANTEGMTVSAWIRRSVDAAVRERDRP